MLSRKATFVLSVLLAALLYAALFAVAPRVIMLGAGAAPRELLDRVTVHLREAVDPAPSQAGEENGGLASRAGSVRDLLERDAEILSPAAEDQPAPADVPRMQERVASDEVAREHELTPDEARLKRIDAKILEIDVSDARRDIEVARRLVRPSPDRILEAGEYPALRSPLASDIGSLRFDTVGPGLFEETPEEAEASESGDVEKPPTEKEITPPELAGSTPLELPVEEIIARAPLEREAETARAESAYAFMDDLVDIQLDSYVPPGESEGYFRVRVTPRQDRQLEVLPKDVTFGVDASNSMHQHKLDVTARGVREAVARLRPEDRFNIVIFRDTPTMFQQERVPGTDANKAAAYEFLSRLESRGETDVYRALLPVIDEAPREGAPGVVMVVTDGRPTTGMRDGRMIINGVTADNALRNSIYAFGGGRTVNRYLLDLLAYRNKGESYVAPDLDDIDEALPRFFARMDDPLLVDIETDYGRIDETQVFPRTAPDFYRGQAVTVYGRFDARQDREFVMRLAGQAGKREKELIFRADLGEAQSGDAEIARNWAFQKAYYLIGEISRHGEQPGLLEQLRQLGTEYGIRTSYDE